MPHAAKSPEDTGAREEGNCIHRSGSLLSLLVDGSPGGKILQLLQFLTTLLESSHGFSTSYSRLIRSFLKPPISSSMTAFSVISEALLCSCSILQPAASSSFSATNLRSFALSPIVAR